MPGEGSGGPVGDAAGGAAVIPPSAEAGWGQFSLLAAAIARPQVVFWQPDAVVSGRE